MLLQQTKAARYCVNLVAEALVAFGQVCDGVRIVVNARAKVLEQTLVIELVRGDDSGKVAGVPDLLYGLREDLDGLIPQPLEFVGREADVREIMEENVELVIAGLLINTDAGSGEVGRTGDHRSRLVLVEPSGPENVYLRVQPLGRVSANGDFARGNVFHELENSALDVLPVRRALDVLSELALKFL